MSKSWVRMLTLAVLAMGATAVAIDDAEARHRNGASNGRRTTARAFNFNGRSGLTTTGRNSEGCPIVNGYSASICGVPSNRYFEAHDRNRR